MNSEQQRQHLESLSMGELKTYARVYNKFVKFAFSKMSRGDLIRHLRDKTKLHKGSNGDITMEVREDVVEKDDEEVKLPTGEGTRARKAKTATNLVKKAEAKQRGDARRTGAEAKRKAKEERFYARKDKADAKAQTIQDRLDEAESKKKGKTKNKQTTKDRLNEAEGKKKATAKTKEIKAKAKAKPKAKAPAKPKKKVMKKKEPMLKQMK
tara:strand:- start:381 stop:1010 length:630 start_codon:yes stop_codon:yes gene_type:complete